MDKMLWLLKKIVDEKIKLMLLISALSYLLQNRNIFKSDFKFTVKEQKMSNKRKKSFITNTYILKCSVDIKQLILEDAHECVCVWAHRVKVT